MRIFSFVGYSKSGKTTVIENLTEVLTRRGYNVVVIKHIHRQVFEGVDSTKFSRFSAADPLLLLEAIVDVFSGSAITISLDEKPQPPEPYARFVVLLGDGEYFSEEFLMLVLAMGIIPVVRPRRDTPYAEHSKPFLRAYTVFFWRYLWWIYRLRKLVERFFSHLARRGKLLSRSHRSACREVYFGVLGKNLATCVSLGRLGGAVVVSL